MKLILNTTDDVTKAVTSFTRTNTIPEVSSGRWRNGPTLLHLAADVESIRPDVKEHGEHAFNADRWNMIIQRIGTMALHIITQHPAYRFELDRFAEFLLGKHRAYGSAAIRAWGMVGIIARIDGKVARIQTLASRNRDSENDESIEDNMNDILGYAVLAWNLIRE